MSYTAAKRPSSAGQDRKAGQGRNVSSKLLVSNAHAMLA